jgi:protease I
MAEETLGGVRVAVLAADGVEQVELTEPVRALKAAGAAITVVGPEPGHIQAFNNDVEPGDEIPVDAALGAVAPDDFDALVLPGGTTNPDKLRTIPEAVAFAGHFAEAGKPIAAICHGPWTLVEADAVEGRTMTSWPSLRTDLRNAGAEWVDEEVVVDEGLVSSRKPDDLEAFNAKIVEEFEEGKHAAQGS